MSFLDTLTEADIKALKATVLGTNATGADASPDFTTEGSDITRTDLITAEKVITKLLNWLEKNQLDVEDATERFGLRFNSVVGKEFSDDKAAFDSIGMNLIQAVAQLMETGGGSTDNYGSVAVGSGSDTSTPAMASTVWGMFQTVWNRIYALSRSGGTPAAPSRAAPMFTELDDCELRCGSDTSIAGWKQVTFDEPMTDIPSVSIQAESDYNALPKVRNVNAQGFEYTVGVLNTSLSGTISSNNSYAGTLQIPATANITISYVAILDTGAQ